MFIKYNPNPRGSNTGDCVIRAMTKALKKDWESAYIDLAVQGFICSDMPSSNHVWDSYLRNNGYERHIVPNLCPDCYTIDQFCYDHPKGTYVLATGSHVVAAVDGDYYDTWDSGNEVPIYYYTREVI